MICGEDCLSMTSVKVILSVLVRKKSAKATTQTGRCNFQFALTSRNKRLAECTIYLFALDLLASYILTQSNIISQCLRLYFFIVYTSSCHSLVIHLFCVCFQLFDFNYFINLSKLTIWLYRFSQSASALHRIFRLACSSHQPHLKDDFCPRLTE